MAKAAVKSTARRGGNPALRLAAIRQIHVYLAMFIAPSVIFFALTGAVQLFGLHESHGDYKPAPVIEKLGMLHKDQVFKARGERKGPPKAAKASPGAGADDHDAGPAKPATPIKVLALKWLFLAVSLALAVSTALGVWMGLLYNRRKGVALVLLLAGAVAPVLLVVL